MWFLILVLFSLILNYEKYDKELIEDTFKKMLLIVLLCVLISIQFPQYIKPNINKTNVTTITSINNKV